MTQVPFDLLDRCPAYNWCDSQCQRCPLHATCAVAHFQPPEEGDDVAHEAPDAEHASNEDPVELRPPTNPAAERLCNLGMRYVRAVRELARRAPTKEVEALASCANLTCAKLSRLSAHLDLAPDESLECDLNLNRLLLEHLDVRARGALEVARGSFPAELFEACDAIRRAIVTELERTFGFISEDIRQGLAALVAQGLAPSPFCTREGRASA